MGNLNIDFATTEIFQKVDGVTEYTYKDIGTENMRVLYKSSGEEYVNTTNTSNIDLYAIKTSLKNLFSFYKGQEILDPEFGNDLYQYLYTPINDALETTLKMTIKNMIEKYQPRIELTNINIEKNDDLLVYQITIKYDVPDLKVASGNTITIGSGDAITFN